MRDLTVGKKRGAVSIGKIMIYLVLIFWSVTTIFPFVWVIMNSLKPSYEVMTNSFALPERFIADNYLNAFSKQNILQAYKNSLFISISVMCLVMTLATMAAFGMTRYQFKGRRAVHSLIIGSLMFPVYATIIPVLRMIIQMKLLNHPLGVILPQTAGNLSFAMIIMMGYLQGLPIEMEEAAYMEGARVGTVFTKIIIPLCKPSLSTVAIFCFLWSYNDLFTQMIMIRRRAMYPICALLNEISSQYGTDFGLMAAAVTLIVIPVLIVYIFLQKNIIKGLTAGAVKG